MISSDLTGDYARVHTLCYQCARAYLDGASDAREVAKQSGLSVERVLDIISFLGEHDLVETMEAEASELDEMWEDYKRGIMEVNDDQAE